MQSLTRKLWQPTSRLNLFSVIQKSTVTGVFVGVAILSVLSALSPALTSVLEFDRAALARGEMWRLVTGHVTHWNFDHLFWDLATFLGLVAVCMRRSIRNTLNCLLVSALAISMAIFFWQPEIEIYRGLSGIDSALFALFAMGMLKDSYRERDWLLFGAACAGMAGFFAKTGYEVLTGQTLFVDSGTAGFIPLASAHAVGAVAGCLVVMLQDHAGRGLAGGINRIR